MSTTGQSFYSISSISKPVNQLSRKANKDPNIALKQGIWIYFMLLLFEGALRRYVLPGLQAPLLIVRDPVAIWLVFEAWRKGILVFNFYLFWMVAIGLIATLTAILFGHGNIIVAIYGARILLFHFPLIFIIGRVFNREDVLRIGKTTLWISIPMIVLIALQFFSPKTAWINNTIGNPAHGGRIDGALGYFRPPGTFSFTTGVSFFYSFLACFVFYFWLQGTRVNRIILVASTVALLASIPLSISRTLLFEICATVFFIFMAIMRKPIILKKMVIAIIALLVVLSVLNQFEFFKKATEVFSTRFTNASTSEGGLQGTIGDRFLGGLGYAFTSSTELPFWGYGIGMGTNVGSDLLTGKRTFLISEDEWGRAIGEMGPLMGIGFILLRIALTIKIAMLCYRKLVLGDLLPWILLSLVVLDLPQGSWSQPTSLGFCVVTVGFALASLKSNKHAMLQ